MEEEKKCNILLCKYHSLRGKFVKNVVPRYMEKWDGFKNIAMNRLHWKECYSCVPNVNYSVLLQSTRRPNRLLVLMCFCSLFSANIFVQGPVWVAPVSLLLFNVMSRKKSCSESLKFRVNLFMYVINIRKEKKNILLSIALSERKYYYM